MRNGRLLRRTPVFLDLDGRPLDNTFSMELCLTCRAKEAHLLKSRLLHGLDLVQPVLIGIAETDTEEIADALIRKMTGLRIFQDENDKTNLNIDTVGGNLLLISQFTLYADCRKGNRPSFVKAGSPERAEALYEYIIKRCFEHFPNVQREALVPT